MAYKGGHRADDGPGSQGGQPPVPTGLQVAAFPRRNFSTGEDEQLRVTLDAVNEGPPYIGLRIWRQDGRTRQWWPTRAGCTVRVGDGRDFLAAVAQALDMAGDRRVLDRLRERNAAVRRGDHTGQSPAYRTPQRPAQAPTVRARVIPHTGEPQSAPPPWRSAEVRQLVHRPDFDEEQR